MMPNTEILLLEEKLWLLVGLTGVPIYDFDFRSWLHTRTPYRPPENIAAIARVGAVSDYQRFYSDCKSEGILLVNSPEQHQRASQLDCWYPLLADLTPRTVCFQSRPTLEQVKGQFQWPVFIKGVRQTSRHARKLSIIASDGDFLEAMDYYARDPILRWQEVACREFVALRSVGGAETNELKLPRRFEFRTFWWKGQLAGAGRYWWEGPAYDWTPDERADALNLAQEAARRVGVPFLVVDVAMTDAGNWIVIECNDGQESGYAGVSPFGLWQKIVEMESAEDRA